MINLIKLAVALTFLDTAMGQLPRALKMVRLVQLKLLKESQASKWQKAMTR